MLRRKELRLFIPGPVEVSEKTLKAMCQPMIGHRGSDFKELYRELQPGLKTLFGTERPVFLSTSSAWGVMEGAIRNLVGHKVLNCMCGAFSDKWFDVSKRCGKEAAALQVNWGDPILPEMIDEKLSAGGFDALTLIHNETSCGVRNPLRPIAEVMHRFPEVMFIVLLISRTDPDGQFWDRCPADRKPKGARSSARAGTFRDIRTCIGAREDNQGAWILFRFYRVCQER
jgi:aspartate aminotransferase-like enzyme